MQDQVCQSWITHIIPLQDKLFSKDTVKNIIFVVKNHKNMEKYDQCQTREQQFKFDYAEWVSKLKRTCFIDWLYTMNSCHYLVIKFMINSQTSVYLVNRTYNYWGCSIRQLYTHLHTHTHTYKDLHKRTDTHTHTHIHMHKELHRHTHPTIYTNICRDPYT